MSSFVFSDYIPIIGKPEIQYGLTPNQSFYDNEKEKKKTDNHRMSNNT